MGLASQRICLLTRRYYRSHSSFILMQVSCARLGVRGPVLGQISVEGLSSRRPILLLLSFLLHVDGIP